MEQTVITTKSEDTQALGEKIAQEVKNGGIVCLYGDLGSGKTTFTQGLAKALGSTANVNSPTFVIVRTYKLAQSQEQTAKSFYHVDLYRLESDKEMEDVGLREILEDPENIVVIEWAEKLGSLLPKKRTDIKFEYLGENQREINIARHH